MQSQITELEKLGKEVTLLKQKVFLKIYFQCVDLETQKLIEAEKRKEDLVLLEADFASLEKENEELIQTGGTLNSEYENLLSNKETSFEETIEREEKILDELREKNTFLTNEVLFTKNHLIYFSLFSLIDKKDKRLLWAV